MKVACALYRDSSASYYYTAGMKSKVECVVKKKYNCLMSRARVLHPEHGMRHMLTGYDIKGIGKEK